MPQPARKAQPAGMSTGNSLLLTLPPSVDRAAVEAAQTDGEQDADREDEHDDADPGPNVRHLRHHRAAQQLAHVGHRIARRDDLEPADLVELRPRVLAAAGEKQRREDEREEQRDPLRLDERPHQQAEAGADERSQQQSDEKERETSPAPRDRAEDQDPDRDHDQRRDQRAKNSKEHLLGNDERGRHRREQPVLDLLRPAELGDEREGERLQRRDHGGEREQAGKEQVRVAVFRVVEGAENLPEHEEQEQRLQDHLGEEDVELARGDVKVAVQDGREGTPLRPLLECRRGDRAHRSVRPVRWMKTSSSVGLPSLTSWSVSPCSSRTAAAGATLSAASPVKYRRTRSGCESGEGPGPPLSAAP